MVEANNVQQSKDNITVGIRVRPPLPREIENRAFNNCVAVDKLNNRIFVSLEDKPVVLSQDGEVPEGVAAYAFDHCFDQDATQAAVYDSTVRRSVDSVLAGYNATVFAYGQTGTGKTFTMQGVDRSPELMGISPRAVEQLFASLDGRLEDELPQMQSEEIPMAQSDVEMNDEENKDEEEGPVLMRQDTSLDSIGQQKTVFVSVLQIYNEVISDLLVKGQPKNLKLRMNTDGTYFVEGLKQRQVRNTAEVMKQLSKAQSKRKSASTSMNDESSRSHLILTLTVVEVNQSKEFVGAKLNLVDLAGSERVKDSAVSGQNLREACHINSSLYFLAGVVDALCKGKPRNLIPYKNSKLTALLSDSLGGNCKTTLLACLSPAQDFCRESNNTLKFAHSCKAIQNVIKPNKYKGSIPAGMPFASKPKSTLSKLKQRQMPWDSLRDFAKQEVQVQFKQVGKVNVTRVGEEGSPVAVLLSHSFTSIEHQVPAYLHAGYQILYIGTEKTIENGPKLSTRSEDILNAGSYAEIITSVLQSLGLKDAPNKLIGGYDLGASIALRMAAQNPRRFSRVIAFHPSMGNTKAVKDEMAKVTAQVLIQWVPADMFHPFSKFKTVMSSFKSATLSTVKVHPWNADCAKGSYRKFSNQICGPIVKFLTGEDPLGQAQEVHQAREVQMVTTAGAKITGRQNITFAEEVSEEELQAMMERPDVQRDALEAYRQIPSGLVTEALLSVNHPKREQVLKLLRLSPEFTLSSLQTPEMLKSNGLWEGPHGWEELQTMPRYFAGRPILVKANVELDHDSPAYMAYSAQTREKFVTHRATLIGHDQANGTFHVVLDGKEDGPIAVPVQETLELNQPHEFAHDVKGDIIFEDSLVFATKGKSEKAKLIEMALKLAPIVKQMDFTAEDCFDKQLQAIKTIRGCLDFIANNVGEEKIMHADRATTGHVGKLSLRGQGNCHGCSSVMGSYLYHFAPLLGLDVKYRSGFSYHSPNERPHPTMDKHQTLEVTCRPSMKTVIVDLWYEGVHQDSSFICVDAQEYYQRKFYPNCLLKLGCRSARTKPSDYSF